MPANKNIPIFLLFIVSFKSILLLLLFSFIKYVCKIFFFFTTHTSQNTSDPPSTSMLKVFKSSRLSVNDVYARDYIVVTSDSCSSGHSENYERILTFSCKSLNFSTKWYTLVYPFPRNCVTKSNFQFKKKQKKA